MIQAVTTSEHRAEFARRIAGKPYFEATMGTHCALFSAHPGSGWSFYLLPGNGALALRGGTVLLTAGCAKYRYCKLPLGSVGSIPRVIDAGQCNDSYSLAAIAMKLQQLFGMKDINDLPIVYNIAWYEQKAVTVLLALLALGVKNIRLGPTLPAFLSPNTARLLIERFGLKTIGTIEEDMKEVF